MIKIKIMISNYLEVRLQEARADSVPHPKCEHPSDQAA